MANTLHDRKIALLATDGFEDFELLQPLEAVRGAGATVVIVSDNEEMITGKNGARVEVDKTVDEVRAEDYHGLLLPGGVINPDRLRMNDIAVGFVWNFFNQHKPVAAICHAPWLLIEAGVVKGRRMTSWPSLRTDIINAGGEWVDKEVVVDQGLITSRSPKDLSAFTREMIGAYSRAVKYEKAM